MKTPTKRPTKEAAPYVQAAPKGMWYESRTSDLPCVARWRSVDGQKQSRSFPDEVERATFAAQWLKQREEYGKAVTLVERQSVETWSEFARLIPDVHPLTVAREWLQWRGTVESLTVSDAWKGFNADQEARKLSPDTHSHRRLQGQRLCAKLGRKMAASVSTDDLSQWLAGLVSPDTGRPMSVMSRAHHLKTARHFFQWLVDRRKIPHNPAVAVTLPDAGTVDSKGNPIHREVNILTVEQARALMQANREQACIGRLALEVFGGLRYSSAARLRPEDIAWDDCGIIMPGHRHKSTKRHYVEGWPDTLWQWMKLAPDSCWKMLPRTYGLAKRNAFIRAGLKPDVPENGTWSEAERQKLEVMKNVARHSFATYHLAAFKDAKLTAYLLTKTSLQSLNNDYRGRATTAAGEAYFAIVP
jgi:integrase